MKSTRHLRFRLRLIEGALVLLLGALTTGAVATHQLLLDATNQPTGDVSFSGPHWVGTLDPARLPASVPSLDDQGTLTLPGSLIYSGLFADDTGGDGVSLSQGGILRLDDGGYGVGALYISTCLIVDSAGDLYAANRCIADADGFLWTSGQSYHPGAATPTGYLTIKDATGTSYRIPAVAAP